MSGNMAARNEPNAALTKVAPSWLSEAAQGDTSVDSLAQYKTLPRLNVLQGMSDPGLKDKFGEGSVIVRPGDVLVIDKHGSFDFVPLINFTEYIAWNDRQDKSQPAIQARTFDPAGDIAARCRDSARRTEMYGPPDPKGVLPFTRRFVEHLCFGGVIYGNHPLVSVEVSFNFSRAEFARGTAFVNAILMRRVNGSPAPLWAQVWRFNVGIRNNQKGRWYGLDYNCPENPWIEEALVGKFRETHVALKELLAKQRLLVDRADEDGDGIVTSTTISDKELEANAKF